MRAQVFKSGNSQAVRIPKDLRLKSKTVKIERVSQGLLITDEEELAERAQRFAALAGSCPDFPNVEPNTSADLPRDDELSG